MTSVTSELIAEISRALKQNKTLPDLPIGIDVTEAYQIQHEVTRARSPSGIAGIKAGVTAEPVQKYFGLEHALIASLYKGTQLDCGAVIPQIDGRLIESEVALKIDAEGNPVSIAPALEVAAVRFAAQDQTTAGNLVICNLGADLFVVGDFVPWESKFNDLTMKLYRDEEVVNETPMSVALGGPGPGARWMHEEAQKQGFPLSPDLIFMMGACGTVVPGEAGHYVGDYGDLGKIELLVQ